MSKLTRYVQQIFGSTANAGRIAKFGSLAAGSPATYSGSSVTPDNVQALSNYLQGWDGAVIGNGNPALQDMNAVLWLFSRQLAYLFQEGIPEYDASTTYYLNSFCQESGVVYCSLINGNTGNDPASNPSDWSAVTRPSVGQQISSSSGSYSATTTTLTNVTNLSVTITTTGRPVVVCLQSAGASQAYLASSIPNPATDTASQFAVTRGGTPIFSYKLEARAANNGTELATFVPVTAVNCLDVVSAGTYTYTVQAASVTSSTTFVHNAVLVAYEL